MTTGTTLARQHFETQVLSSRVPVLVAFLSSRSSPCQMMDPVLVELAQEYAGRLKVLRVDVDDNAALAGRFGVRGVPTLIFFNEGLLVGSFVGLKPKAELTAIILRVI